MSAVTTMIGDGRAAELQAVAPTLQRLVSGGVSVWTNLGAAAALGVLSPGNREALALASEIFAPNVTILRTGAKWTTPKNYVMRREAAAKAIEAIDG